MILITIIQLEAVEIVLARAQVGKRKMACVCMYMCQCVVCFSGV